MELKYTRYKFCNFGLVYFKIFSPEPFKSNGINKWNVLISYLKFIRKPTNSISANIASFTCC